MRCQCCDNILTEREEIFNIENPQGDGKEFCYNCMRFCSQGIIMEEYLKTFGDLKIDGTDY